MADLSRFQELAARINAEHQAITSFDCPATYALESGRILRSVKEQLSESEWLAWLDQYIHPPPEVAHAFMEVSRRWDEIERILPSTAELSVPVAVFLVTPVVYPYAPSDDPDAAPILLRRAFGLILNWAEEQRFQEVHRFGRWMADLTEEQIDRMFDALGEDDEERIFHSARYHGGLTPLDVPSISDIAYAMVKETEGDASAEGDS